MDANVILMLQGAGGVATIGMAYGAVKTALNGTKERVREIDGKLEKQIRLSNVRHEELIQRSTSVETKLDMLINEHRRT